MPFIYIDFTYCIIYQIFELLIVDTAVIHITIALGVISILIQVYCAYLIGVPVGTTFS